MGFFVSADGFEVPTVRPGQPPKQGPEEPEWAFAKRLAYYEKAQSVVWGKGIDRADRKAEIKLSRDLSAYKQAVDAGYQPTSTRNAYEKINGARSAEDFCHNAQKRRDADILRSLS